MSLFHIKIVILIIVWFFTNNISQLTNPSPQEPIQDEEKEHPQKIGHQVLKRTNPMRHDTLNQFYDRPITKGEENRIDICWPETGAKRNKEQECSKKIGDKMDDLIPPIAQVRRGARGKGNDGQKDHPPHEKNIKLP